LSGRVAWHGPPPAVAPPDALPVCYFRPRPGGSFERVERPAPNFPAIDPVTGGLAGAAVFLRGIDPAAARPWDHPPVTVELHDERPMARQGDGPPRSVGFVRRGDAVSFVSRQPRFHALCARGVPASESPAFWALTFPDPDRPLTRRFDRPGLVELSSAAGHHWMRGYLWVSDHPYFTLTDAAGGWELTGVPPGEYELVVWHPNWRVERLERDPESGAVVRAYFRPPVERALRVTVKEDEVTVPEVVITKDG